MKQGKIEKISSRQLSIMGLVMLLVQGHFTGTWVGTGTGVLLTTTPVTTYNAATNPQSGYGLMSTPRMRGTNEFVFFSSSDVNYAATGTAPLKIHLMRYQNNLLSSISSSPFSNAAGFKFGYLESEGLGYIACPSTDFPAGATRICHGDRFTQTSDTFATTYQQVGAASPSTFRYRKLRGNGSFKRFVMNEDKVIRAFQPELIEASGFTQAAVKPACQILAGAGEIVSNQNVFNYLADYDLFLQPPCLRWNIFLC